mgnify:CR=1 FL=1
MIGLIAVDWNRGQSYAAVRGPCRQTSLIRLPDMTAPLLDRIRRFELEARSATLRSALGARPESVPPNPEEVLASVSRKVEECATLRASAEGHLEALRQQEGDLPGAIEATAARKSGRCQPC